VAAEEKAAAESAQELADAHRKLADATIEAMTSMASTDAIAELVQAQQDLQTAFGSDAAAAEDAQNRIDAAYQKISDNYREVAAEIALQKIGDMFAGDATAAQAAYLQTQVALGNLSQEQADYMMDVENRSSIVADVTGSMFDKFLADGDLTVAESESIAAAVSLIEESANPSATALQVLAENGISSLSELQSQTDTATGAIIDLKDAAQEAEGGSPYELEMDAETEAAAASINELAMAAEAAAGTYTITINTQVTGAGIPGNWQVPDPHGAPGNAWHGAFGGWVTGGIPGRDSVPSLLMPDEIVIPANAARNMDTATQFLQAAGVGGGSSAQHGDTFNIYTNESGAAVDSIRRRQRQARHAGVLR
jgi:hypothetical protein